MKWPALAVFALAVVAAHCWTGSALRGSRQANASKEGLPQGVGPIVSEWYLSLKTSKGYCGLVSATDAAGGYGFAIACNNKYPQYDTSFALLLSDVGDGEVTATAATAVSPFAAVLGNETPTRASSLTDASAPIVVPSGRSVRLLARSAGLCNTPPVFAPKNADGHSPTSLLSMGKLTDAASGPYTDFWAWRVLPMLRTWVDTWRCTVANVLQCPQEGMADDCDSNGIDGETCDGSNHRGGSGSDNKAGVFSCRWFRGGCRHRRRTGALEDVPPRAVICSLGQPSALSYKIFKADLKDDESVDLDKEWVYLKEGDKYCTLTDVAGMSAVVSCYLDSPGWTGYKFQLQRLSYPRSQLYSLLTESPCGVRLPGLPGPHDIECQPGEQAGRSPEVDLVLQIPGSPLAAGVVVGLATYSPGLMGIELQRCCSHTASPHIILCESPTPGPVANECWFQMYDVKIASPPVEESAGGAWNGDTTSGDDNAVAVGDLGGDKPRVVGVPKDGGSGVRAFLLSFLRALQLEMSHVGINPDLEAESSLLASDDAAASWGSGIASGDNQPVGTDEPADDPWVNAAPKQGSTGVRAFLLSFLCTLQQEMGPSGLDPDLDLDPDAESSALATGSVPGTLGSSRAKGDSKPGVDGDAANDPWVNAELKQDSSGSRAMLFSFLRALQLEMSPSGLDQDLDVELDSIARSQDASQGSLKLQKMRLWLRSLLLKLGWAPEREEPGMETVGEEATEGGEEASVRYARRLLSGERYWKPDGRPDPQPSMRVDCSDGVTGAAGVMKSDTVGGDASTSAQVLPLAMILSGEMENRAAPISAEASEQPMGNPNSMGWDWLWAWVASSGGVNVSTTASRPSVSGAEPLQDGSLVMLLSRAFSRYCSVSLDGTLLCISAQASNASRNLFTLFLPSMPPMPAAATDPV